VATKTYSIRTLFELGKKHDWIRPALQGILIEDYHRHSAAYKVTKTNFEENKIAFHYPKSIKRRLSKHYPEKLF
jgi:hypothetical protein